MKKNSDPTMAQDLVDPKALDAGGKVTKAQSARVAAAQDNDDREFSGQHRAERDEAYPKDEDTIVDTDRAGIETRMKGTLGYGEAGGGYGSFDEKNTGLNRSLHSGGSKAEPTAKSTEA